MNELKLVAYHEAGHAVLALDRGVKVTRVSLANGGLTGTIAPPAVLTPQLARRELLICLGGPMAEAIHKFCAENINLENIDWTQRSTDFDRAKRYASIVSAACGQSRDSILDAAARETWSILEDPVRWLAVEGIAANLLRLTKLTGDQVVELFTFHTDPRQVHGHVDFANC